MLSNAYSYPEDPLASSLYCSPTIGLSLRSLVIFCIFLLVVNSTDAEMACVSIWIKILPLIQSMNNAATDWPIPYQ